MKKFKLGGTVTVRIIGAYCEEYINFLISNRVRLSGVRNEKGIIYADMDIYSYPFAARSAHKYGVRTRVKERHGVYFGIRKLGKRPGLVIGTFISVMTVLFLRLFVWNIEIHGNHELTNDHILNILEGYGITAGVVANDTNTLEVERNIMLTSDKIKWINIEINGSKADVYVSEIGDTSQDEIDLMTPCNIVASRTGVIVDSDISSGSMLYENGSGVAEGSVIVSGTVSSGTSTILVHSDGSVIADFYDEAVFSMDFTTTEKVPTGESFTQKQIMILGMVFPLGREEDTSDTICTESTEQCKIFGIDIPVKIKTDTYTRYNDVTVTRKTEDVRRILDQQFEMYKFSFLKQYELLDAEKTYDVSDTGVSLKVRMKLRGDIGVKQPIYTH